MTNPIIAPIRSVVIVNAPPAVAYSALTNAYLLRQWFPTQAKTDPRLGGSWNFVWKNRDRGNSDTNGGKYLKLVPGRQVAYTWKAYPGHTKVSFKLSGRGGRTRVAFEHSGWRPDPRSQHQRKMVSGGWSFFLKNLKAFLDRGVDQRPKWGMKVER